MRHVDCLTLDFGEGDTKMFCHCTLLVYAKHISTLSGRMSSFVLKVVLGATAIAF